VGACVGVKQLQPVLTARRAEPINTCRQWLRSIEPRELLRKPAVYDAFQSIVGANNSRRQFMEEFVAPLAGNRVLEVGCGPGGNCRWVPPTVEYVGIDISPDYVRHARAAYGDRAEFYVCRVGNLASLNVGRFAAVIAVNLLHHLADAQVIDLCEEVTMLLGDGGVFITADPCITAEQSRLERWITMLDRGRYVRAPGDYADLMLQRFDRADTTVRPGHARFPNTGTIITAWNGGE
jgi:SAM-dependent methyltransferase